MDTLKSLWTWAYSNRNLQKWKSEKQILQKTGQNIQELWENYKSYDMYLIGLPEGEASEEKKKYLKQWEFPQINWFMPLTVPGT